MGRDGRGETTGMTGTMLSGMLPGVVSGVIWGALVGALVLSLAALVIDSAAVSPVPDAPAVARRDDPPSADSIAQSPLLLRRVHGFWPPASTSDRHGSLADPRRSLAPRPAQPVLPVLVTGAAVPAPDTDLPAVPRAPEPSVPIASVAQPAQPQVPARPVRATAPSAIPPPRPAAPVAAVPPVLSGPFTMPSKPLMQAAQPLPAAPGMAIAAHGTPRIDTGPAQMPVSVPPLSGGAAVVRATTRPLADTSGSDRPPAVLAMGPQIAFILDEDSDAARPDWLLARARRGDGSAMVLDGGDGAVFIQGEGAAGYLSARAAGTPALLVYDRLGTAEPIALDRIATRARRDGTVAVLVPADAALWDGIAAWLDGPARDLDPVPAARLLD